MAAPRGGTNTVDRGKATISELDHRHPSPAEGTHLPGYPAMSHQPHVPCLAPDPLDDLWSFQVLPGAFISRLHPASPMQIPPTAQVLPAMYPPTSQVPRVSRMDHRSAELPPTRGQDRRTASAPRSSPSQANRRGATPPFTSRPALPGRGASRCSGSDCPWDTRNPPRPTGRTRLCDTPRSNPHCPLWDRRAPTGAVGRPPHAAPPRPSHRPRAHGLESRTGPPSPSRTPCRRATPGPSNPTDPTGSSSPSTMIKNIWPSPLRVVSSSRRCRDTIDSSDSTPPR